ncbi:hypothetical protein WJX75_004695 [Coccomyxa subellipsoidea]|uniref:BZIP domain-containing protein n=1 Tax=Coccomyxa subellipsoidea TaxID=248742 RepID=A0ABR2Z0L3_9CHLO
MTAGEEEVSSECLSNVPPLSGLCYRQRRCAIEACSPCISTELTASKFDERGCRGRFSDAAEAGFRTPLPMCQSSDLADGHPQPISAELLLTAQKKLREAFEFTMPPRPLITGPFFRGHAAQEAAQPLSAYTAHFEPTMMPPPPMLEAQGSWPIATCVTPQPAALHPSGVPHSPKARTSAAGPGAAAATSLKPMPEGHATKENGARRARLEESDEDTLSSSSSSSGSRKRKRHAAMYSKMMQQESWAATELALQRQQMQARVEQLEGYNAHLIRQLSTTLRTLRSERTSSQAEITRLHQKCAALAAFLPPSVAAFALGNPPEIAVNSRAALLRTHSTP